MFRSKIPKIINIKTDEDVLKQVPKLRYLSIIFAEDGKNKWNIIQRIKETKVMFNNKKQLLFSNNLSLEMEKKCIKFVFGVLLFIDQKHGS